MISFSESLHKIVSMNREGCPDNDGYLVLDLVRRRARLFHVRGWVGVGVRVDVVGVEKENTLKPTPIHPPTLTYSYPHLKKMGHD